MRTFFLLSFLLLFSGYAIAAPIATMKTNFGIIRIELNEEKAPITVANFLSYANSGFYNGTIFHRVINNFMIQGGGFDQDLKEKETGEPIKNESKNGLRNVAYTISMARNTSPDTATAQFFINVVDNLYLDGSENNWGYAVFGKVIEGKEVVDAIKTVPTRFKDGFEDVPLAPVIVESVSIAK